MIIPQISEVKKFIAALTGNADSVVTFQTFCDFEKRDKDPLAQVIHGTIRDKFSDLVELNDQGYGVFVTVNETDLKGRSKPNIKKIRAVFADSDGGDRSPTLRPSMIVNSSKDKYHYYFKLTEPSADLNRFTPLQAAIAAALKTDPVVKDLPRVMRLAGFFNMKDRKNPFLVNIKEAHDARYTLEELESTFPPINESEAEPRTLENPLKVEQGRATSRAIEYLESLPVVTKGGRDNEAFKAAARLKDFGLEKLTAAEVMSENFNAEPPLDPTEITTVVNNAYKYGENDPGVDSPEAAFAEEKSAVEKLNEQYMAVNNRGDTIVIKEAYDHATERNVLEYITFPSFCRMYMNQTMVRPTAKGKTETVSLARAWLESKDRRQYLGGLTFAPARTLPPDVYNLWRGLNITPKPGNWARIKEYIFEIICDANDEQFSYLMGWLANMFQNPGTPGQVANVFKGPRGTGKTTLIEMLSRIWGQHGIILNRRDQLTGRFLGHLRDKVFVASEEAFWVEDKEAEAQIKSLITNTILSLEEKFEPLGPSRNCTHLMFATNESHAVPAALDGERRFAIYNVSNKRRQDREYFGRIKDEAYNQGGLEAMAHYFLHEHDLKNFDVFQFPNNAALTQEKLHSLTGFNSWLYDALSSGSFGSHDWPQHTFNFSKHDLYQNYIDGAKHRRDWKSMDRARFGKALFEALPGLVTNVRVRTDDGARSVFWAVAPLNICREAFVKIHGLAGHQWDEAEAPGGGSLVDLL